MSSVMTMEQAKRHCSQMSGVSNVTYELLAILSNKLRGIAAMEEYKLDAREADDHEFMSLLDQLELRECEDVASLKALVATRLPSD